MNLEKKENPVIFLFPGTCCHWKANFGEVIPLLERNFYVVCVSYDGFDKTEDTVFPDMFTETKITYGKDLTGISVPLTAVPLAVLL